MINSDSTESAVIVENKQNAVNSPKDSECDQFIIQLPQLEFNREYRDELNNVQEKCNELLQFPMVNNNLEIQDSKFSDTESDVERSVVNKVINVLDNLERKVHFTLSLRPAFQKTRKIKSKNYDGNLLRKSKNCDGLDIYVSSCPKSRNQNQSKNHDDKLESIIAEIKILNDCEAQYERFVISRMIHIGLLKNVNNIIHVGKMTVIIHANYNPKYLNETEELPKECVIKIFRRRFYEVSKFTSKYLITDFYKTKKEISQKDVRFWGKREMTVLKRLANTPIHCPKLIAHRHNIVVQSFIGHQQKIARPIKDLKFTAEEYLIIYKEITEAMRIMFQLGHIVHGNLSKNNILWHDRHCYFIDFSPSLDFDEASAYYSLYQDCIRIIKFFDQTDIQDIFTPNDLFKYITGGDYCDRMGLLKITNDVKFRKDNT